MSGKEIQASSTSAVRPYDRFVQYLSERAQIETADYSDLVSQQVEAVLSADTEDELFAAMSLAGLTGLKDLEEGTAITIHGWKLLTGALGIGVYAVIDATNIATGEGLALNTGIERVMAFLRMAESLELMPVDVIVHHKATGSGNELTTLSRPARKPVRGSVAKTDSE